MIVHLTAAEIADWPERRHQHQFNENAIRMTRTLGVAAGLGRIGVHLVRLEPGRASTQHHWHDADERYHADVVLDYWRWQRHWHVPVPS